MDLRDFVQNEKAKQTLLDMVQKKRISHAVLLAGPRGAGKKTFARLMAAAILCDKSQPCFVCPSCHKALSGAHPDVQEYTEHLKPRSFPVDKVRQIRREAYIFPNEGERRVFIIANAESMGAEAQNALLKIIEEPPAHAVFILTVQDVGALLPTVLSRVITVPIAPVSDDALCKELLKKHPALDRELVDMASALAQGSIGRALAIVEDQELQQSARTAVEIIESAMRGDRYETLRLLHQLSKASGLPDVLDFAVAILENANCKKADPLSERVTCSAKRTLRMLEATIAAKRALALNANKALLMAQLCVRMYR